MAEIRNENKLTLVKNRQCKRCLCCIHFEESTQCQIGHEQ